MATLSYSALNEYERCGYRFYAERVLRLPARGAADLPAGAPTARGGVDGPPARRAGERVAARAGSERGILLHALLERLNFRAPLAPTPEAVRAAARAAGLRPPGPREAEELISTVERFAASSLRSRLARTSEARREQRFAFPWSGC